MSVDGAADGGAVEFSDWFVDAADWDIWEPSLFTENDKQFELIFIPSAFALKRYNSSHPHHRPHHGVHPPPPLQSKLRGDAFVAPPKKFECSAKRR